MKNILKKYDLNTKNKIKIRFDKEGIEIPFPHVSLYSGSDTKPIPINIVNGSPK